MMETSSISNNLGLEDTVISNAYLKTSKPTFFSSTQASDKKINRPRVIQWDPHMGTDQSTISVVLEQAVSDSFNSSNSDEIQPMKIVFGQLAVETSQQQQRAPSAAPGSSDNSQLIWVTLVARVPRFSDTQIDYSTQKVPLSICTYDSNNRDTAVDHWEFGMFTYSKINSEGGSTNNTKKRTASDMVSGNSSSDLNNSGGVVSSNSFKRQHLEDDQLFNQLLAPFDDSPGKNSVPSPEFRQAQSIINPNTKNSGLSTPVGPASINTSTAGTPNSSSSLQQTNILRQQIPNSLGYVQQPIHNPFSNSNNNSYMNSFSNTTTNIGAPSHQTNPNTSHPVNIQPNPLGYSAFQNTMQSYQPYTSQPPTNVFGMNAGNNIYYSQTSRQPTATTLMSTPQQAAPIMMNSMSSSTNPATTTPITNPQHPFAGVLSRANLKIVGQLQDMTFNWSPEEWANGRRLVQFWRRQTGENNQVECGFESIEQEAYQQQRIRENLASQNNNGSSATASSNKKPVPPLVVSCIYWQERNDYFITSVDCIYLLEGLIGVQFTVEEKNRIRRNLEGFRPLTVSKCKPECADFFKLIMSFPHPKPRNIEKDVKVFAWNTLSNALTKIIRKYTPSYSSTAAVA